MGVRLLLDEHYAPANLVDAGGEVWLRPVS
jgi:hypothetical protein